MDKTYSGFRWIVLSGLAQACLVLYSAAGCVSVNPPPRYTSQVGEEPVVGHSAEVRVGDPIYTKYDFQTTESIKLVHGLERDYPACLGCVISVPSGAVVDVQRGGEETIYCTRENYLQARFGPGNVVCFTRHAAKDEMIQFRVPGTLASWSKLSPPTPFDRVPVMVGNGFKAELVYQGVAAGVLRLLYREYSGDLMRPAFQQELTYTLSPDESNEVGFRNLRLEVIRADNSGISYRVINGL